jgi:undecaprenyl-diphosphatase
MTATSDTLPTQASTDAPYLLPTRTWALAMGILTLVWLAMLAAGPNAFGLKILQLSPAASDSRLAAVALFFTQIEAFLLPLGIVAAGWLATRDRKLDAIILVASMLTERLLVNVQKAEFLRGRPDYHLWLAPADGLAFPSGHAASSMLICSLTAFLIAPPQWRKIAVGAAIALSICVGLSRMLLRVHWPTDVIAGWAFGLFWMLGALMVLGSLRQAQRASATL